MMLAGRNGTDRALSRARGCDQEPVATGSESIQPDHGANRENAKRTKATGESRQESDIPALLRLAGSMVPGVSTSPPMPFIARE